MTALNTSAGWSNGDPVRVLISSGLAVSPYSVQQVTACMNQLAALSSDSVNAVLDLLDQYEDANNKLVELNNGADGKTLTKADVLEWTINPVGVGYSPEREVARIRGLIFQYFGFCPLMVGGGGYSGTALIRS
jgi:hypothetical protein